MKLFAKYNRTNIITTVLIFVLGSISFFFVLRYVLIEQMNEDLRSEQQEILQYLNEFKHFAPIIQTKDQLTVITPTTTTEEEQFYSIKKWNPVRKTEEWFREIRFTVTYNNSYYKVTVSDSEEETHDLLDLIILITIGMIGLILLANLFINRLILTRLWKPFYRTIDHISNYNINSQQPFITESSSIDEIDLLNKNISGMVNRVQSEYKRLKEFTGNAAHEMQTPLAIIRTKLDLLAQHENLLAENAQTIQDIELAVHKLSKLFNSLLLLTKIENGQFELKEEVALNSIIEKQLSELSHYISDKELSITADIEPIHITLHQQLAEILIGNLLNNAIRYNSQGGHITITLDHKSLTIANSSPIPALDKGIVFQRFYRHSNTRMEGNGLGLSIAKQICDAGGYQILYNHYKNQHIISILF